jgi:hypothetical protein
MTRWIVKWKIRQQLKAMGLSRDERRIVMGKIKAFFGGLKDRKTSEFWMGWSGMILKTASIFVPGVMPVLDTIADTVGFVDSVGSGQGEVLIAVLLSMAVGRMTSKVVKAA